MCNSKLIIKEIKADNSRKNHGTTTVDSRYYRHPRGEDLVSLIARVRNSGKKRGSVIYSTDRENEANKMFIIWLLPVWETGNKCRTHDLTVI